MEVSDQLWLPPRSLLSRLIASGADVGGRIDAIRIESTLRLQSLYVPGSDGGERVSTAFRASRYHRAEQPPSPGPEADSNRAAGELWTSAGFALVVADARGTGASFGSRTIELGPGEIDDYGELIDWVAAQPWSNGRVGVYGTSYE